MPQALTLLNGFVEKDVLRRDASPLMGNIRAAKSPSRMVETAYLSILNRKPTSGEMSEWRRDVDRLGMQACQDLVWTLVNSHEFRFVQ